MRLVKLDVVGEYKSIKGTIDVPFTYKFGESFNEFNPLCLVGLNGSGKSNFIELLADIFGFADRFFNPQYTSKNDLPYNFYLEYLITGGDVTRRVLLQCNNSQLQMFFMENDEPQLVTSDYLEMLPTNVIAYSSGQNQGLSSVFAKTQFQYYEVIRKQGVFYREYKLRYDNVIATEDGENDSIWKNLSTYVKNRHDAESGLFKVPRAYVDDIDSYFEFPEEPLEPVSASLPIGLFTDHSLNNLVFVYLMVCRGVNKNKSKSFRRFVSKEANITGFCSFDVDLRLAQYRDFETVGNIVERLIELSADSQQLPTQSCPSSFNKDTLTGILHFKINKHFYNSFKLLYLDETIFLEHLFTLNHLTAKRWSYDEKRTLKTDKYERNVPNVAGGLMPMRIMNIKIKYRKLGIETLYDRLSDGEHQLIQVIGSLILFDHQQTLFILDEPESHFNPEWRMEFIELIDNYVNTKNIELLISTHSPFILSACESGRVLHFQKDEMGNIEIEGVDLKTYGASFDTLLTSVFDLDVLISKKPLQEIREILSEYDTEEISDEAALDKLKPFGDSFELNFRRNKIRNKIAEKSIVNGQGED
jgi:predicted ATPase